MVQKGSKDTGRVTAASKNAELTETQSKSWDLPVQTVSLGRVGGKPFYFSWFCFLYSFPIQKLGVFSIKKRKKNSDCFHRTKNPCAVDVKSVSVPPWRRQVSRYTQVLADLVLSHSLTVLVQYRKATKNRPC